MSPIKQKKWKTEKKGLTIFFLITIWCLKTTYLSPWEVGAEKKKQQPKTVSNWTILLNFQFKKYLFSPPTKKYLQKKDFKLQGPVNEKKILFWKGRSTRVPMSFAAKGKETYRKHQKIPLNTCKKLSPKVLTGPLKVRLG